MSRYARTTAIVCITHCASPSLSLSISLPVDSAQKTRTKNQETRQRKRDPCFSDLSHYPIPTVFAKFSFPPLEEKRERKKKLHVDDQDGVRSRKLAGLSLHNNIIGSNNNKNKRRRLIVDTHTSSPHPRVGPVPLLVLPYLPTYLE